MTCDNNELGVELSVHPEENLAGQQGDSSVHLGYTKLETIELETKNNAVVEFDNYLEEMDDTYDNDSVFDGDDSIFECEEDENKDNMHNIHALLLKEIVQK